MNRHRYISTAVVAAVLLVLGSCGEEDALGPGTELLRPTYLSPDRPENVIANLVLAYQHRDIEAYERLLAPEFVFRFQPGDVAEIGRASWGRDEDIRATRRLFASDKVCGIEITLTWDPAVPAREPGLEHTMLVRVTAMVLEVTECGGIAHRVDNDYQYFYLRREDGEEPTGWMIVEWRDVPGPGRAG